MNEPSTSDLKNHLATQGTRVLGAIVAWTLSGFAIPRDVFREAMEDIGLGGAVGRDPKPITLARAAIADATTGRTKDTLIRQITKDDAKVVWGVVRETRDRAAVEVKHAQRSRIALFPAQGTLVVDDIDCDVSKAVQDRFEHRKANAVTVDVSKAVVTSIVGEMSGLKIAGRGGAYFVRADHIATLRKLGAFLEREGGVDTIFTVLEITGDGDNLAQAGKRAAKELTQKVREVLAESRSFVGELRAKDSEAEVPERVMDTRMRRFREIRDQADLYADLLGELSSELKSELHGARMEVLGLRVPESHPAAPASVQPADFGGNPIPPDDSFAFDGAE